MYQVHGIALLTDAIEHLLKPSAKRTLIVGKHDDGVACAAVAYDAPV